MPQIYGQEVDIASEKVLKVHFMTIAVFVGIALLAEKITNKKIDV